MAFSGYFKRRNNGKTMRNVSFNDTFQFKATQNKNLSNKLSANFDWF